MGSLGLPSGVVFSRKLFFISPPTPAPSKNVIGWLAQDADSEMKGFYWRVLFGTTPVKEQGKLLGEREKTNCNAIAKAFSTNPGDVKLR